MAKTATLKAHALASLFTFILALMSTQLVAQAPYTDGPIELQVKVRDINTTFTATDEALLGVGFAPDELTYKLWARDIPNLDGSVWNGGACLQDNFLPATQSIDFNYTMFNFTYAGANVPRYFGLRLDAHEDDLPSDGLLGFCNTGSRCTFEGSACCGVVIFGTCIGITTGDDNHCDADSFVTQVDYRQGPPCQWYSHGYMNGNCPSNNFYEPRIESFWRYTDGTSCANAIPLGNFFPSAPILSHFNSNECYTNVWTPSPGNDVFYEFNVTQPTGVVASLCANASFNTNLYLLDGNCNQIAFDNNTCGVTSEIRMAICNPGTYFIVVDGNAAADMGTFTLTVQEDPSLLPSADAGSPRNICLGTSTPIGGSPTGTGGAGGYTYSWTPNAFITDPTIANPTVFPPVTTRYYVTVTDANNCVAVDSIDINVNPGPPISLGNDTTICASDTITLDAGSGWVSYFWNQGANTDTLDVSQAGQYHVAIIDINGCLSRDTIQISNYPLPPLNLGADTSICQGTNITFDAGPGMVSYQWNTGNNSQFLLTSNAGTYDVEIVDGNSCRARDTVALTIDPLPVISLGNDTTVCVGEPVTWDPGTGFVGYSWNNGSTNQTVTVTTPGNYAVTVTDINGCQGSDNAVLNNYIQPTINLGPDQDLCFGDSVTLDAGGGFTSYGWVSGQTTQTVRVTGPGSYSVIGTNVNGCVATDTVNINLNLLPVFDLGNDTTICAGQNVILDPGPGYTGYLWQSGSTSRTFNVNSTGQYYVTVTDGNTCEYTDTINIIVDPLPVPSLGPDLTVCPGDSVLLDPGPGFATCTWNTGETTHTVIKPAGSYTVTVTNATGCSAFDDITISNFPAPSVNLGPDQDICPGGSVTLDAGAGFSSYLWYDGSTTQTVSVVFPGLYDVVVTDANGCQASDTLNITLFPQPVVDLGPDTVICQGGSYTLDAGPAFNSYAWTPGGSTGQTLNITASGNYSVTATDANGCDATDDVDIGIAPTLTVDLGQDTVVICDSGSVMLDAGAGLSAYLWNDGSTNQWLDVSTSGTYSVTVTDQFGCDASDQIVVETSSLISVDLLGPDTSYCKGAFVLLDAGDQWLTYWWDNGSTDQYLIVSSAGTYTVIVEDADGCRFTDVIEVIENPDVVPVLDLGTNTYLCDGSSLELDGGDGFDSYVWSTGATSQTITVSQPDVYSVTTTFNDCVFYDELILSDDCPGEGDLYIPTAFTPNGDGLNDQFVIPTVDLEKFEIVIYNRMGREIFRSDNPNTSWTGNYQGFGVQEGAYVYVVTYKWINYGETFKRGGTVTVVR